MLISHIKPDNGNTAEVRNTRFEPNFDVASRPRKQCILLPRNLRKSHLHGLLYLVAPSWTLPRDNDEFGPLEVKK